MTVSDELGAFGFHKEGGGWVGGGGGLNGGCECGVGGGWWLVVGWIWGRGTSDT